MRLSLRLALHYALLNLNLGPTVPNLTHPTNEKRPALIGEPKDRPRVDTSLELPTATDSFIRVKYLDVVRYSAERRRYRRHRFPKPPRSC